MFPWVQGRDIAREGEGMKEFAEGPGIGACCEALRSKFATDHGVKTNNCTSFDVISLFRTVPVLAHAMAD